MFDQPIDDELHAEAARERGSRAIEVDMGGLVIAFSLILKVLIDELEKTGVVSRADLLEKMKLLPQGFKQMAQSKSGIGADTLTIDVINQFVSMYDDPKTPAPWKPTVIDGGKDK